jgi:NAD(P)H-dependent FMN reductase
MKSIVILSGSIREGRKSHFLAQLIFKIIKDHGKLNPVLLDLKEYPFPVLTSADTDKWPAGLKQFSDQLSAANGIVIISPEYKNGIPGALKNALDYLNPQLLKRIPLAIATVSSGEFGGLNCLSQLRLVALALGAIPIAEKLCISKVNEVFDNTGKLKDSSVEIKTNQFIESFLWYVQSLT